MFLGGSLQRDLGAQLRPPPRSIMSLMADVRVDLSAKSPSSRDQNELSDLSINREEHIPNQPHVVRGW